MTVETRATLNMILDDQKVYINSEIKKNYYKAAKSKYLHAGLGTEDSEPQKKINAIVGSREFRIFRPKDEELRSYWPNSYSRPNPSNSKFFRTGFLYKDNVYCLTLNSANEIQLELGDATYNSESCDDILSNIKCWNDELKALKIIFNTQEKLEALVEAISIRGENYIFSETSVYSHTIPQVNLGKFTIKDVEAAIAFFSEGRSSKPVRRMKVYSTTKTRSKSCYRIFGFAFENMPYADKLETFKISKIEKGQVYFQYGKLSKKISDKELVRLHKLMNSKVFYNTVGDKLIIKDIANKVKYLVSPENWFKYLETTTNPLDFVFNQGVPDTSNFLRRK